MGIPYHAVSVAVKGFVRDFLREFVRETLFLGSSIACMTSIPEYKSVMAGMTNFSLNSNFLLFHETGAHYVKSKIEYTDDQLTTLIIVHMIIHFIICNCSHDYTLYYLLLHYSIVHMYIHYII